MGRWVAAMRPQTSSAKLNQRPTKVLRFLPAASGRQCRGVAIGHESDSALLSVPLWLGSGRPCGPIPPMAYAI
jgi:hypothetical protein